MSPACLRASVPASASRKVAAAAAAAHSHRAIEEAQSLEGADMEGHLDGAGRGDATAVEALLCRRAVCLMRCDYQPQDAGRCLEEVVDESLATDSVEES